MMCAFSPAGINTSWINTEELVSSGSGQHTEADTEKILRFYLTYPTLKSRFVFFMFRHI